jgi:hypothetical protein
VTDDPAAGLTAAEAAELRRELDDLRKANKELSDAKTAADKASARDAVDEAEDDLEAVAKRIGVSPAALRKATAEAKKAERKEELRPILYELLDELEADDPELDDDKPTDDDKPAADDKPTDSDKPAAKEKAAKPKEDAPPVRAHWSERGVGELIR